MFQRCFEAVPLRIKEIRDAVGGYAASCGLNRAQLDAVVLAVSEAVTNAIVHGYRGEGGPLRVCARCEDDELIVVIADSGGGHQPRIDSPGAGLGTPLMAMMAKRLEIKTSPRGTAVHMAFDCGQP